MDGRTGVHGEREFRGRWVAESQRAAQALLNLALNNTKPGGQGFWTHWHGENMMGLGFPGTGVCVLLAPYLPVNGA